MRTTCLTVLFAFIAIPQAFSADVIARWNFNSLAPDGNVGTGTTMPSVGSGTATLVGNTSATFATGATTDGAASDNSGWNTAAYPVQGTSNKLGGVQFAVSTVGYESIVVSWDHRASNTGSRHARFQYSVDGVNFFDLDTFAFAAQDIFYTRSVSLNSVTGANNNPNFAFRIVAEFESTATGAGVSEYQAARTSVATLYSPNGTWRFDTIVISGSAPDANNFPTISTVPNQTIRVDTATDPLPFQVGDVETPADLLNVTGVSSNPTLVPNEGIIFGGAGADRNVTIAPNFDAVGTTTITLTVTDGGGKTASSSFVVTVLPNNTAPTLSTFTNVHTLKNTPFAPINFTISDSEQSAESLTVTALSLDQAIVPDSNIVIGGAGSDRTLNMTPADGVSGTVVILVTVTDNEGLLATNAFNAMIVRSSDIVFEEPFNYANGPLIPNAGRLWTTRAGSPGQIQVSGHIQLTSTASEDAVARLIGGPYNTSGSTVLYASFDVTFSALPAIAPDIFAHFSGTDANNLRARVLASTTNAAAGFYRIGVANTTSTPTNVVDYPLDLSLNTSYQVVVAHDLAAGSTKLWVNPASGGAPVDAIDPRTPIAINAYGVRQSGGIGDLTMDNLLIGTSFENVTPNLTRVRIRRNGSAVEVYWPSAGVWEGFFLESTSSLANPDWQPVNEPSTTVGDWDVVTITNPIDNKFFRLTRP